MVEKFRTTLNGHLTQGFNEEYVNVKLERDRLLHECARMAKALLKTDDEDRFLLKEYQDTKVEYSALEKKVEMLGKRAVVIDRSVIKKQLEIDLRSIFPKK